MSRIGKMPIIIPTTVTVKIEDGIITVGGSKGELSRKLPQEINLDLTDGVLKLSRVGNEAKDKAMHGLWRSLIANMVMGVSQGYLRNLKLVGTGYRVRMEGEKLVVSCGFSHPVVVSPPAGIKLEALDNETIQVSGINNELVGQTAAKIRAIKPPEPYKGKGIHYEGEVIRRKAGKSGKAGAAGAKGAA